MIQHKAISESLEKYYNILVQFLSQTAFSLRGLNSAGEKIALRKIDSDKSWNEVCVFVQTFTVKATYFVDPKDLLSTSDSANVPNNEGI